MRCLNSLPLLVGVCLVFGAGLPVAADEVSADELRQLRELVIQQQHTIQRLEENQARQARKIEELKRQISAGEAGQSSAPTPSEQVTQEEPEADVPHEVTNTPSGSSSAVV